MLEKVPYGILARLLLLLFDVDGVVVDFNVFVDVQCIVLM